ncbi:MAG: homoserine dehydrogenase [Gammaproteobacteria bacterium]|nr:homoserine dehydrogenase [Gammaproteobacteria bacterium]
MQETESIRVGICGLGTVGGGTLELLRANRLEISDRLGKEVVVSHVATRTLKPELTQDIATIGTDPLAVASDPNVDILVETIGGCDIAFELIATALAKGKQVVTANKALIAERGNELFVLAEKHRVNLAFESSVGGGIPVIRALREGLAANEIQWLAGIINGTGNFILTEMAEKQREFSEVLKQAQKLGYAEADPAFDVEGIDAAHKLTIMASIVFGIPLQFDKVYMEGISHITPHDISYADELGYCIKHLGIAQRSERGMELRVHPTLLSRSRLLASVNGVGNAVLVNGNRVGSTLYYGPGAGAEATASSVVADIIDIARQQAAGAVEPVCPALGYRNYSNKLPVLTIEDIESEYYLRIPAMDRLGVMARISSVLQSQSINIEAVIQKESSSKNVPIVILTHKVKERNLNQALATLEALEEVTGSITRIRVESFHSGTA